MTLVSASSLCNNQRSCHGYCDYPRSLNGHREEILVSPISGGGLYWENGKENGNHCSILGLYRDNGNEMETTFLAAASWPSRLSFGIREARIPS